MLFALPIPARGAPRATGAQADSHAAGGRAPLGGGGSGGLLSAPRAAGATEECADKCAQAGKCAGSTRRNLLDSYVLGEVLGQGSFGIVYACSRILTTEELAVKMVDKVDTPVAEIRHEAELQQRVKHPNIVKVHDVFFERCFVCIVMDAFMGGDLMGGMEYHWDTRGRIDCYEIVHVCRQMVAAVAVLHSNGIVHRDVKGDNYLIDRLELVDPDCHVALSDFGTATCAEPQQRLRTRVGTRNHWAPEIYNRDYGPKVDVWALGVVTYGLVEGVFPFNGEQDAREKRVSFEKGTPAQCADFIQCMLQKAEKDRRSAADLADHPWLETAESGGTSPSTPPSAGEEPAIVEVDDEDWDTKGCRTRMRTAALVKLKLRESGANAGVLMRRRELVKRMKTAAITRADTVNGRTTTDDYWENSFEAFDKNTSLTHAYEWWSASKAQEAGMLQKSDALNCSAELTEPATLKLVEQMLVRHGISTDCFGKDMALSLGELADEVRSGKSRLMVDAASHKKLVRVVDVVLLRLCLGHGQHKRILVETDHTYPDGRVRRDVNRLPGSKKEPHENARHVVERTLGTVLNTSDCRVVFDFGRTAFLEKEEESVSFPGVRTVYRIEIVRGKVATADEGVLAHIGSPGVGEFSTKDAQGKVRRLAWWTEEHCSAEMLTTSTPDGLHDFSSLVMASIGFEQEELRRYLESNGIDLSRFGRHRAKTVDDLAAELNSGESSLEQKPDGRIVRVIDAVHLELVRADAGEVLVEVSERLPDRRVVQHQRLPGGKRRPDENQFLAAQRILRNALRIDENCVTLDDADCVRVVEEEVDTPSYPGLRTFHRRRVVSGRVHPPPGEIELSTPSALAEEEGDDEAAARRGTPISAATAARWRGA